MFSFKYARAGSIKTGSGRAYFWTNKYGPGSVSQVIKALVCCAQEHAGRVFFVSTPIKNLSDPKAEFLY